VANDPLSLIAIDNPVSSAILERDYSLLHLPGRKQFKAIAKREKKLTNMAVRFQGTLIMQ
jgi:hypothetical protein